MYFNIKFFSLFVFLFSLSQFSSKAEVVYSNNTCCFGNMHETSDNKANIEKVKGNSIQIDPVVLYTLDISPDELIADLKKANITSVHFVVVSKWDGRKDDNLFRPEYIQALEKNGIAIWLMLAGNCMYDQLPKEWEMEFLKPFAQSSLHFYSFHNDEYVQWQEDRVYRIFKNYDFSGIGFAETYFPEWKTIYTNGHYGDVSLAARRKFTNEYLGLERSPLTFESIKDDSELYSKWQDFRVEAIINFNHKMKQAVREASPEAVFASWGIAVGREDLSEIRKWYGLDIPRIVKEVKPDVFFIQTSYQDWGNSMLTPDYIYDYEHMKKAIQKANPNVKVAVQADIASLSFHNPGIGLRVPDWWMKFMILADELGYYTNTSYEYAFTKKQGLWIK